ncbi:MAG TPA: hypothetical protein VGK39_05385, partial [Cyclobacteriaceae bacterium]
MASRFFALAIIFLTLSSFRFLGLEVKGAQLNNYADAPNYVVIGAFSVQKNAVKFTTKASELNLEAKYEMNPNRNLYYVYVLATNDRQQAINEALRLRKESPYNDTWVYHGSFGQSEVKKGIDINPVTETSLGTVEAEDTKKQIVEAAAIAETNATSSPSSGSTETKQEESVGKNDPSTETSGKSFYFKIFRADDQNQVEGDVNVIDAERSRKIGTYAGNKEVTIADPSSKEDNVSLVCEVFGYRKVQREINYRTPEGEGIQSNENNATVVPFELVRLQKGDIAVMYNVYFFKDAGVMRPESRYEVTSLLNMLNENPKYKIKIHGHTNGGAHGKIISLDKGSQNYFSLNETKDGVGSAKKLS